MSRKAEDFSDYSLSEYGQPMKSDQIEYTDPRFYQAEVGEDRRSQPAMSNDWSVNDYSPLQMREYAGHQPLEYSPVDSEEARRILAGEAHGDDVPASKVSPPSMFGRIRDLMNIKWVAVLAAFGVAGVSALISVGAYTLLFGWEVALGLVALLFIHEMGHAVVMKFKHVPLGGMIFIPLLGAAVIMRNMPKNARDEAEVAIAGPLAGALASSACLLLALHFPTMLGFWSLLAYFGFFMNLLNLIPIAPFDGGRVLAAIDRRIWFFGFLALVAVQIWEWVNHTSSIWLIAFIVIAAVQLWTGRASSDTPERRAYYTVPLKERIILGLAYFGLAGVMVLGVSLSQGMMFHIGL